MPEGHDPNTARSFSTFLPLVENGQLHGDLSQELCNLVAELHTAARENAGKAKGKLALTLNFKLEDGVVEVTGDYTATLPKKTRGRSIFWATPDNHLTQQNPRQRDMFRDVTAGDAGQVRTV
jgi:hypothetical protein